MIALRRALSRAILAATEMAGAVALAALLMLAAIPLAAAGIRRRLEIAAYWQGDAAARDAAADKAAWRAP